MGKPVITAGTYFAAGTPCALAVIPLARAQGEINAETTGAPRR